MIPTVTSTVSFDAFIFFFYRTCIAGQLCEEVNISTCGLSRLSLTCASTSMVRAFAAKVRSHGYKISLMINTAEHAIYPASKITKCQVC